MHKKYLELKQPLLVDGDFMGICLDDNYELLNDIVEEGVEREEVVYVGSDLFLSLSETSRKNVLGLEKSNLESIVNFLESSKNQLSSMKSGMRCLVSSESLFKEMSVTQRKFQVDYLLKFLMNGKLSIGCVYPSSDHIELSQLCSHPRLYVGNSVRTNPYFILPRQYKESQSDLELLLDHVTSSEKEMMLEGETFPMGLNSADVSRMLESIIDSMGAGVVVGDMYGNMVLFNKAAHRMMGLPASPLPYAERIMRFGNYLPDTVTPYPYEQLPLSRAIRGENFDNELIFIRNAGKPKGTWLQVTGRGVKDFDGNLIGGVLVSKDITEERELYEENERLQKNLIQNQKLDSLEVLAGGIAHDFNNLLVGVLGNASIILQQIESRSVFKPRLEQIQQAGLQLSDLTKQLLIYAGISPSKGYKKIDLNELVGSMIGLVEAAVSKKMLIEFYVENQDLYIEADEVQIRQILLNLAMNAADAYGIQGGSLKISTHVKEFNNQTIGSAFYSAAECEGLYAGFEVQDFAGGIDTKILSKIFDPFFSTKGMGRGLGLSAVLGIVKTHKGFLELHTSLGEGTCFKVWFPVVFTQTQIQSSSQPSTVLHTGHKILVIDDEELVLEVAASILTHHGMDVVTASSGRMGLSLLKELGSDVSLVILDMNMPDMNGDIVYREIRAVYEKLPVIISSGFSKELCGLFEKGGDHCLYLEKPYSASTLLSLVSNIFSK